MIPRATPEQEQEANYFAMHLLVPSDMLRPRLLELGGVDLSGDDSVLKKLAREFGVSMAVMAYRIGEESARR